MFNTNENEITINQNFPRNTLSLLNHSNIINTSKLLPNINLTIQSHTTRRNYLLQYIQIYQFQKKIIR